MVKRLTSGIWGVLGVSVLAGSAQAQLGAARPVQDDIFYQIMPMAWRDSNNDAQRFGDFGGLTASLDYLEDLGVTAVYIQPIFPSNAYHGYQHGDALQLNSRFGTEAQFLSFVNAAHARGIKVFLDMVVYGVSTNTSSPWYASAAGNPASVYDQWLAFTNGANTQYEGYSFNTWNGQSVGFIHWNLANQNAVNVVTNWARKWLDPNGDGDPSDGVDGFRLDHVYADAPEGWGANTAFWNQWQSALKALKPDVFNFAEQGEWGNYGTDILGFLDSCFTKPFMFAARDAITNEQAGGLYDSMNATLAALPGPGRVFLLTMNDHDVTRLATQIGDVMGRKKVAAAVQMTAALPPVIYFGDELGMRGSKNTGYSGDAADIPMREPFKWSAVAGPPMSNYFVLNTAAYNGRIERDNNGRSVQEQTGVTGSLLETYRSLIATRKNSVALRHGSYTPVTCSSSRVYAFVRHEATQTVLVAINLNGATQNATLNLSNFTVGGGSTSPTSLETGGTLAAITNANKAAYPISLPAHSWFIASVALTPPPPPPGPPADVDGVNLQVDTGAKAVLATQNNTSSMGDNVGELNQLLVKREGTHLRVSLSGNLPGDGTALALFVDKDPGVTGSGQNVLATSTLGAPPAGLAGLTGLRFDAEFSPDTMFFMNSVGGTFWVDQVFLHSGSNATKTYRGTSAVNSGEGTLAGGTNPNGIGVAFNNTNTAGITASSAANAATATKGIEFWLPLVDLGLPEDYEGEIGFAAFIELSNDTVTNQWLPGLGGGRPNAGVAPNMTTIPGDQFVVLAAAPPAGLPGDANGDCFVNGADLSVVLGNFGASVTPGTSGDFNGDGVVNGADLSVLLAGFGTACD